MKDIQHNLKVSSSPTRVTWSGVSSHVLPWSTGASRTSAWRALHYSTCWCLLLLPELLPEPQKPRGDMCLFAKGTRSFFILQQKQRQSWLSFGTVWGGRTGECCFPGVRKNQRTTVPCLQGSAPGFCAPLLRLCVNGSDDAFNER